MTDATTEEKVNAFERSRTCPDCGSTDTRLSRKRAGIITLVLSALNMSQYRCRACGRRFTAAN